MTAQDSKGFEMTHHDTHRLVTVRMWGHWDQELTRTFRHALGETLDETCKDCEEWKILMDVTAFHLQADAMERMLCEQIEAANRSRIRKIAFLGIMTAVQQRLDQLFQQPISPQCEFFQTREDALQWLQPYKKEPLRAEFSQS